MKLRRKICCQENISISSVGANENNKYVVTENDEINGTAERSNMDRKMTRQLSQSDGNVFESSISQTNKPSFWSWFLGLFNQKRKVENNDGTSSIQDVDTDGSSNSKKALTDGKTCPTSNLELHLNSTPAEHEQTSTTQHFKPPNMPIIAELPSEIKRANSADSLAARLNKINLECLEKSISTPVKPVMEKVEKVEKVLVEIVEKTRPEISPKPSPKTSPKKPEPEVDLLKPVPSARAEIKSTTSVKQMQALLGKNGPLCIPMKTPTDHNNFLKSPSKVPVLPVITVEKSKENINGETTAVHHTDFSFEKQKITLRQRTKNTKRPISKKFRNSMQVNSILDDIMNEEQ